MYFTNFWAILAYSGGMPILYPIALINYFFLYWILKFLFLKAYKKTSNFNQNLPIQSMYMYKFGLFMHITFTIFMYTYSELMYVDEDKIKDAFVEIGVQDH